MQVMGALNMYQQETYIDPQPTVQVYETKWVRASNSGILRLYVKLGQKVIKKQVLYQIRLIGHKKNLQSS
ncbi:MAG: hypothetical protein F6K25_30350 [Okeania sp. SIO2G4]|uniref:hypothetical protein n=1 Tax=unclassified Okeania TaxID=2634635 RepID=UPI0013B9D21A|nr:MULTISPECIES: hypothetical protein [unclassified Okeania]NEP06502.1 hypothetical protein [Okeania sp. SIO4D6]NEP73306.1 hypothetical protein [Okeania sp. SIO2G5]NEP91670.1 hypothetical protein [Okeania sp. SIO2F5]NEQ94705.1 hypothetical protein [Okeania sp. SIO2G4]